MEIPINTLVADMVEIFDDRMREDFEERSAIMEFDTNFALCKNSFGLKIFPIFQADGF